MSQLGRYTGVVRDELSYLADQGRQTMSGADPGAAFYRANLSRYDTVTDSAAALVTQVMTSVALFLRKGDVVTNLTFRSGATPAGTPTNWWFALYNSAAAPALLQQSADQLTGAWAANTAKTLALAAPYTVTADGIYWAACMVKATTVPSLVGVASLASAGTLTAEKNLAQNSGSALVGTAPATIATPTVQAAVPLAIAT